MKLNKKIFVFTSLSLLLIVSFLLSIVNSPSVEADINSNFCAQGIYKLESNSSPRDIERNKACDTGYNDSYTRHLTASTCSSISTLDDVRKACEAGFSAGKDDYSKSQSQKPNAAHITLACNIYLNNKECETFVKNKNCSTITCVKNNADKFPGRKAVLFCRNQGDPRKCQKDYQEACGGKTGANLRGCQTNFTTELNGGVPDNNSPASLDSEYYKPKYTCGSGDAAFKTQIDFGCRGEGNPIMDLAYSILRFLSVGVGLVLIGSMIYAGIMYTTSGGSPEQTTAAKNRIRDAVIALAFYLLIFAMIQFLVPGGFFNA